MLPARSFVLVPFTLHAASLLLGWCLTSQALAGPTAATCWQVDDLRPGMKGQGKTVMKGTRLETFEAEVLGVLKNTSPGRDLVLCRLSGLGLEKSGVIAGMSGSPVYIDGRLVGAVAYAWPYGTEPIAGVTPFSQMHQFVESYERRDVAEQGKTRRVGLRTPVWIDGTRYDEVSVAQGSDVPGPSADDGLMMVPLRTPLAATGFTPGSLALLRDQLRSTGLVPVQGGAVAARVADDEKRTPLQPGGPLSVSLVTGDFDLSGIGTVTHIEGNRVYGWGHPFMSLGACELPLMTGYIHTIYPRLSVSFKMGSPLQTVGVINADVSTGIAGWLGRKADLMPMQVVVAREDSTTQTFNVQVVRQRAIVAALVHSVLTNAIDMEGDLPDEMTALLKAKIDVEGFGPVEVEDTFSGAGISGNRAPQALYSQVASLVSMLQWNPYKALRINRIDCSTQVQPGRRTADVEAIELLSDVLEPGETLRATVHLTPHRGTEQRLRLDLKLPDDMREGEYTATICDDLTAARQELRDNPNLFNPHTAEQLYESLRVQTSARRTNLAIRVPLPVAGVAVRGKSLPSLPPSMAHVIGNTRRGSAQTISGALVARLPTEWVLSGSESVKFTVTRHKKVLPQP